MNRPLKGLKVLDLTTFVAAPCTGRLLADLGAEVIKIEKNSGDTWRYTGIRRVPARFSHDENPIFDIYNTGKRFLSLNLKTDEGMEIFFKILDECDIFVTNTRLDALKRLGIDYDSIKEKYPRLIYARITGYGEEGPDASLPAFDSTAFWSRCGMLRDMAVPTQSGEYMPIYPPISVGDSVCAYLLIAEINAALYEREKTGKGQHVESCLFHTGIFNFGSMVISTQGDWGEKYPRTRPDHSVAGGYYECKDGEWIFIGTSTVNTLFHKLCMAIGRTELESDERFNTPKKLNENHGEFYKICREIFLTKTSAEWLQIAKELDFAMIKMAHFSDVSKDEQAWANGFVENVTFANGRTDVMPTSPIHMESVSGLKNVPAGPIGCDNESILKELGYSDAQINELDKKGIITAKPEI